MSSDMMAQQNPEPPQGDYVARRLKSLSDDEFKMVYTFFLKSFGLNRHSSPWLQMRSFLLLDREEVDAVLGIALKAIGIDK